MGFGFSLGYFLRGIGWDGIGWGLGGCWRNGLVFLRLGDGSRIREWLGSLR